MIYFYLNRLVKKLRLSAIKNSTIEKTAKIEELTVDQAIMKMDLADLPALVFINKANNRVNVVYNRKDGNISWVDPILG